MESQLKESVLLYVWKKVFTFIFDRLGEFISWTPPFKKAIVLKDVLPTMWSSWLRMGMFFEDFKSSGFDSYIGGLGIDKRV